MRTSCKRARACFIATARVYGSDARICAWIFMKFETKVHKIVIDHHIKFHKDQSFGCGDICKTKLTLVQPFICIFAYLQNLRLQKYRANTGKACRIFFSEGETKVSGGRGGLKNLGWGDRSCWPLPPYWTALLSYPVHYIT